MITASIGTAFTSSENARGCRCEYFVLKPNAPAIGNPTEIKSAQRAGRPSFFLRNTDRASSLAISVCVLRVHMDFMPNRWLYG